MRTILREPALSIIPADVVLPLATEPAAERVAVVIPCHRVIRYILDVIHGVGPEVGAIYVVDDACPENCGALVEQICRDPRALVYDLAHWGGGGATAGITALHPRLAARTAAVERRSRGENG